MRFIKKYQRQKTKGGFTLTEIAIVLGIIGLVVGAIWVAAAQVTMNKHIAVTNQQLTTIVGNIRTIYAEQGGISNGGGSDPTILTKSLDQLRAFPLDMRAEPVGTFGILFHQWNTTPYTSYGPSYGNVFVTASHCTSTGTIAGPITTNSIETCFGIYFYYIPQTACVQLLMEAISTATGLQTVFVNGNNVSLPTNVSTANSLTNCGFSPTANTIEFVYQLKDTPS